MESVTATAILAVHPDVVWRDVDGEIVLLNVATGQYYGLDGTASRVWQLLGDTGCSLASLCEALTHEFDIDRPTLDADVRALIGDLVSNQLVTAA